MSCFDFISQYCIVAYAYAYLFKTRITYVVYHILTKILVMVDMKWFLSLLVMLTVFYQVRDIDLIFLIKLQVSVIWMVGSQWIV